MKIQDKTNAALRISTNEKIVKLESKNLELSKTIQECQIVGVMGGCLSCQGKVSQTILNGEEIERLTRSLS